METLPSRLELRTEGQQDRPNGKPRNIIRLDLTPEGKEGFAAAADRMEMTFVSTTDQLIAWLDRQCPGVQAAVLGQYPNEIAADVARLLVSRMDAES